MQISTHILLRLRMLALALSTNEFHLFKSLYFLLFGTAPKEHECQNQQHNQSQSNVILPFDCNLIKFHKSEFLNPSDPSIILNILEGKGARLWKRSCAFANPLVIALKSALVPYQSVLFDGGKQLDDGFSILALKNSNRGFLLVYANPRFILVLGKYE